MNPGSSLAQPRTIRLEAAEGEKVRAAREMLLGLRASRDDVPCARGHVYCGMQQSGRWLRRHTSAPKAVVAEQTP